jgi:adenylate kinase family enzyme
VGLPAAGKSTFAQALVASDSAWVRISEGWGEGRGQGWG